MPNRLVGRKMESTYRRRLRFFVVISVLMGAAAGFVFGVSRSGAGAKPMEIEVIDSKANPQGSITAIGRYGNYGGGFLYTESRVEVVLKQANQECIAYSREAGGRGNPKYAWSGDTVLTIKDYLDSGGVTVVKRCFAVRMHITELDEYEGN